ncbi:MAG: hypothetical protein ACI4IH_02310, partial [Eubacterium sp.]
NHGLSWQILPLLFVKILVNPKGLTAFCALIKTKSAHDKLQSIKNAWSKDEIWRLEMAALLAQGNSESDKYRFNTAFLTGSDYYRYPKGQPYNSGFIRQPFCSLIKNIWRINGNADYSRFNKIS